MAIKNCAEAFQQCSTASDNEKMGLLRIAVDDYSKLYAKATRGLGFDRHLFALKCLAEENGQSLAFFEDPAYANINHIILHPYTTDMGIDSGSGLPNPEATVLFCERDNNSFNFNSFSLPSEKLGVQDYLTVLTNVLEDIHHVITTAHSS